MDGFSFINNILWLRGPLDGGGASRATETDLYFTLIFRGVIALRSLDLSTWLAGAWSLNRQSCFDEVKNSAWAAELGGAASDGSHRHFSFCAHDDIADVICERYELTIRPNL